MPSVITPNDAYTDVDGAVWVQEAPGKETFYIGNCYVADALGNPKPDVEPIWCLDENRNFKSIGSRKSAPGKITTTLTGLVEANADWLERFVEDFCPFWLYYVQGKCGTKSLFAHWQRVYSIRVEAVTDDVVSNLMSREGGNNSERAFSFTAFPPRTDSRQLTISRKTTTETMAGNDIAACPKRCPDSCGYGRGLGEYLNIAHDADTGVTANILRSVNSGGTWAATATDPFAADEHALAIECFEMDRNTVRILTVRGTDATAALEVGYSDDAGATWTNVNVGSTNGEAGTGPQCLFVLDADHIWLVTDDGNVFFSSDGGATWTDQNAAGASGGNALQAVHFVDHNTGYAVGVSDTVITTVDGGENWTAATATGGAGTLNTVQVLSGDGQRLIVGDNSGDVFISWDGTASWTTAWSAGAGTVTCISFSTETTGLMTWNSAGPVGTVYQTVDGGYSWRALTTPTNVGLNSVVSLSPFLGWAVGEAQGGTAVILEIS